MHHQSTGADAEYIDPVIEAYKRDIDRTLIRENLKLTPHQRVEKLQALMRGIEQLQRAGRVARGARSL